MADVFISYASGDRAAAERIARAIEKSGLSVWWDRHIKGGAEFSRDIEEHLDSAAKVLVLWSKEAVHSRWVRDEASVAIDTHRLVAATIDGTPAPLGFRQFQTLDLKRLASRGGALPLALADALGTSPQDHGPSTAIPSRKRNWQAVAATLAILAFVAAIWVVRPGPFDRWLPGQEQADRIALAVMPFTTSGTGGDKAYLGPGMASALAGNLAELSGVSIAASTSTQAVARRNLTAPGIARELRVTHLVEGDIQRNEEGYTIAVRLIDARSSDQLWARSFEGTVDQLQRMQDRMSRELAGALSARLGAGKGNLAERRDVDPRAYEAYLRALERVSVRDERQARLEAIRQFKLAATIQPDFADAHAGYAYLMALSVPRHLGTSWPELIRDQQRATARALALDPDNDLALVAKATAFQNFEGEIEQSTAIARQVLKRSPDFGPAHYSLAASLMMAGQGREAVDHIDRAIDRDPFDSLLQRYRAIILHSLGDYEAVRAAAMKCGEDCADMTFVWYTSLVSFGTPEQYRRDFPLIAKRAKVAGVSAETLAQNQRADEALIFGGRFIPPKVEDEADMTFPVAAEAARLVSFEEGLRYARVAADRQQPDSVVEILTDGRFTFTPEQRADPRYHQLFRHPKLIHIATARRKRGVNGGLPVFPIKPYTGR